MNLLRWSAKAAAARTAIAKLFGRHSNLHPRDGFCLAGEDITLLRDNASNARPACRWCFRIRHRRSIRAAALPASSRRRWSKRGRQPSRHLGCEAFFRPNPGTSGQFFAGGRHVAGFCGAAAGAIIRRASEAARIHQHRARPVQPSESAAIGAPTRSSPASTFLIQKAQLLNLLARLLRRARLRDAVRLPRSIRGAPSRAAACFGDVSRKGGRVAAARSSSRAPVEEVFTSPQQRHITLKLCWGRRVPLR